MVRTGKKNRGQHVFYVERSTRNFVSSVNVPPPPPEPKKAIRFENVRTDEEIVNSSNYEFTLEIEDLLKNPKTTRRATNKRRRGPPRPQNSFILYLRDTSARIKKNDPGFSKKLPCERSKIIGQLWKKEPKETKDLFKALANMAEKKHARVHEDYRYCPRRTNRKIQSNDNDEVSEPIGQSPVSPTDYNYSELELVDYDSFCVLDNESDDVLDLNSYQENSVNNFKDNLIDSLLRFLPIPDKYF